MTRDVLWYKEKLPFMRVPLSPPTVLYSAPFSSDPEPPVHIIKKYKPTGKYDDSSHKYEYIDCGYER